ncbi:VanW family protein [Ectobacillus sp. JY-23]|uniref:VanW family protein n=1 Tax=Ectobacillus sp. JY-23 TaxID=2933872 RepID=UPI001FF105C6|nr:VanW family protein [Ectobacillus sp. JY-23]UOY92621.1 VanW family protein [Ectobacillus sp. JY-23]
MNHFARLGIVVGISCTFVFFVQFGLRTAMMKLFDTTTSFQEGTYIGSVNVSGMGREQAQQNVQKQVDAWLASSNIQITYQEATVSVPATVFVFDVPGSVASAKQKTRTPLIVTVDSKQLTAFLQFSQEVVAALNQEVLQKALQRSSANLERDKTFVATEFLQKESIHRVVAQSEIKAIDMYSSELGLWLSQYKTLTLEPGHELSLQKLVKDKLSLTDGALSVIATLMNEAALSTNLEVRKRSISLQLPAYAEAGTEARIEKDKTDFVLYNPNTTPYTLRFQLTNSGMSLSIEGLPFAYIYTPYTEITDVAKSEIVQVITPAKHDAVTVRREGSDGLFVKVYRDIYRNGAFLKREQVAEDRYLPVSQVKHALVLPKLPSATVPQTAIVPTPSTTEAPVTQPNTSAPAVPTLPQ